MEPITRVLTDTWTKGIQGSKAYKGGGWEWQLKGNPCEQLIHLYLILRWVVGEGQGSDAIPCRRLVATILAAFSSHGWHLFTATTIGKKACAGLSP